MISELLRLEFLEFRGVMFCVIVAGMMVSCQRIKYLYRRQAASAPQIERKEKRLEQGLSATARHNMALTRLRPFPLSPSMFFTW